MGNAEQVSETESGEAKGLSQQVGLTSQMVQEINKILSRGKGVEIAVRNGKLVVWETSSKKICEADVA